MQLAQVEVERYRRWYKCTATKPKHGHVLDGGNNGVARGCIGSEALALVSAGCSLAAASSEQSQKMMTWNWLMEDEAE
jgi:peptide methionine sulfoxide reductase MsrB